MKIMSEFRLVMSNPASSNDATCCHSKAGRFLYQIENSSKKTQSYKKNPVGRAFLVAPQKVAKKSQDYKKRLPRHFAQIVALQLDAFSCTTPKFIQATNKYPRKPAGTTNPH